jgi:hypothetical protein
MTRILSIPDRLYGELEQSAQLRGLPQIEQLIEAWQQEERLWRERETTVDRIRSFRAELEQRYGMMEDSLDLIREDRDQ